MKILSFMILLLTLVACGKETKTNSSSSSTQLSVNGLQMNRATIYIPAPGMVGGGSTIKINGTDYRIDTTKSSSMVQQYLNGLYYNAINVAPISSTSGGKQYNVAYNGNLEQGACLSNPTVTCTNAVLTQLVAF